MSETFVTSTHIAPIVDVSTYTDGPFSYDSLWSSEEEAERAEGRVVCADYDSEKLGERIVEEANKVFEAEKPLAGYGVVEIKATKFGSPREYNFMSDWLDLSVKVDESFFEKARKAIRDPENRKAIIEYCKDHWVSKDGFHSFMLNRVQDLSLNWWEHERYGRHMSTDEEIEAAVMADLQEVLTLLETETSEDESRDFGAVLALLWCFEYPEDLGSGSWITDLMQENFRCSSLSSLSDFCTVLDKNEIKKRFGAHMIDFDAETRRLHEEGTVYLSANFANKQYVERLWTMYEWKVEHLYKILADRQLCTISRYVVPDTEKDWFVNERLDELREEIKSEIDQSKLLKLWKEAEKEVQND